MAIAQLRTFTAFRTVEDHPGQQIFSEIFKAMHLARSGKKRIAGTELKALAFDKKPAATGDDDVEFITRVRLLQICTFGRVDLDRQRAMAEEFGVEFAVARWDGVLRVGKFDDAFSRKFHFVSSLRSAFIRVNPR